MKQIERQDIKLVIDMLNGLDLYNAEDYIVYNAINMLEHFGNAYHTLQLENTKLKQDILQLEAMIDD